MIKYIQQRLLPVEAFAAAYRWNRRLKSDCERIRPLSILNEKYLSIYNQNNATNFGRQCNKIKNQKYPHHQPKKKRKFQ